MEIENSDNMYDDRIKSEHAKIDEDWLVLHYKVTIGMVVFGLILETIMSFVVINSTLLATTVPMYLLKYLVIPSGINFICIGIDTVVMRTNKISQKGKINIISIVFVMICCVMFIVHNVFISTYSMFSVAIILTVVYANRYLTLFITALSMILLIFSELFIVWNVERTKAFGDVLLLSNFFISLAILGAVSAVSVVIIGYEQKKNLVIIEAKKERKLLQTSLKVDELTGIFNRKALHNELEDLQEGSLNRKSALIIMDIDRFKVINDTWGHMVGDLCLIEVAKVLLECCGREASFRYAGDEFCLLFYNKDIEEIINTCEIIQGNLKSLNIKIGIDMKITASFGVVEHRPGMSGDELFVCADQALYKAKELRNKIEIFNGPMKNFDKRYLS